LELISVSLTAEHMQLTNSYVESSVLTSLEPLFQLR